MHLEALGNAADRLQMMGGVINQELKEQNLMLDQLDSDMDDAGYAIEHDSRTNVSMM